MSLMRRWLDDKNRKRAKIVLLAALIPAAVILQVDDWTRDLTGSRAEMSEDDLDRGIRDRIAGREAPEIVEAIRWAAFRLGGWHYVGTVADGATTLVTFRRTSRLLRLQDEVTIRVRDAGNRRLVSGRSEARLRIGDLGRNPRNLRRLLREVDVVLGNAAPSPAPFGGGRR